jgi:thiosulfate/3-mercaptopyruvate sulfurtransferase
MHFTTIVSTETLEQHLYDPDWIIVDCRFDLSKPEWGRESFDAAHVPGAYFADLEHDLSGPRTPSSGRHPLPTREQWLQLVTKWGIGSDTQVVAYDSAGGSLAAVRAWWLLRAYGHRFVAVLDGGLPKWLHEGRPLDAGSPRPRPARPFSGDFDTHQMVSTNQLVGLIKQPEILLLDARAPERFRGEVEPIDPVAGHIPGAINRPSAMNLNPDLTFKSADQLRREFKDILGNHPPENVITYCGSGVTGIHDLLAMEIAGLTGARLYAGSWSEWIRDPSRPVAKGSKTKPD